MKPPIGVSDFYEPFPSTDHRPGDIWSALPTYGVLPPPELPSVVITPACDLINRKVETLTYLPIVPITTYLCSRSCLQDIVRATEGQIQFCSASINLHTDAGTLIRADDVHAAKELLAEHSRMAKYDAKQTTASVRANSGLEVLISILEGGDPEAVRAHLLRLFDSGFDQMARRFIKNSHSGDVHFLPPDEQGGEWSVIQEPSLAMFRYPMTIPLDLLDLAGMTPEDSWQPEVSRLEPMYPCTRYLANKRPVKVLRMNPDFISDLLTRFTGLYGRLGSPDFTGDRIEGYIGSMRGPA